MSTSEQGETTQPLSLKAEYSTPYSALVRDDVVMGVPRYFLERWLPVLGTGPATVVNTLRQLDYRCHGDAIVIGGEALAREAAMSRRYLYTCLDTPWVRAFVRQETGQRSRSDTGKITQQANRYYVRMDDPLVPADAEHLTAVLSRLADTPLVAARRALELEPRDLWAPNPAQPSALFSEPRPISGHDVLQRAFPTWAPADPDEQRAFAEAAEALHHHVTLVHDEGKTSKIIVPQYLRTRWWKRLGHDLAWAYLWLRGCVFDHPDERIRRATCWIPSLNTLLAVIGRPREWWRRNVENASPRADGWSVADFFQQLGAQKGRDPEQPQWVARQFHVALMIPIAPEDRARYAALLATWQGQAVAPPQTDLEQTSSDGQAAVSATFMHTGSAEVRHIHAHRLTEGLPHTDTPDFDLSATNVHIGDDGVCHTRTQGSATPAHREKESKNPASLSDSASSVTSKHHEAAARPGQEGTAVAGEGVIARPETPKTLVDQLARTLRSAPETPLYQAVDVQTWLLLAWPEPVRPHTPVWSLAAEGRISARDLVALMLAVWSDATIQHPPRYLSWLVQRWQDQPATPPVSHWSQWRTLAEMPLNDWANHGLQAWGTLATRRKDVLPFGLDALMVTEEAASGETQSSALAGRPSEAPALLPPSLVADGLDERPGGSTLTMRDIWRATLGQLSVQLNRSTYTSWVEGAQAESYADGVLTVRARHAMARDMLARRLNDSIERTASMLAGRPITVRYTAGPPTPLTGVTSSQQSPSE